MRRIWGLGLTVAFVCGCSGSGSVGDRSPSPPGARTQSVEALQPVGMVAAAGKVWTVDAGDGAIIGRAAPGDEPVRVSVGKTPLRAAYDGKLLWVSVFGADRVVAVDPTEGRVVQRVRVGGQPEGIVAAFGAVWVVRQEARKLTKITDKGAGPSYRLGDEPRLVAASDEALFASNFGDGSITRIDPKTGRTETGQHVCDGAQDMAATADVVWVACTPANEVVAVDAKTLRPLGRAFVDGEPDAIQFVGSKLYVVTTGGPTIVELNGVAADPDVVHRSALGKSAPLFDQANVDAAVVDGTWWVSSPSEGKVYVYTP